MNKAQFIRVFAWLSLVLLAVSGQLFAGDPARTGSAAGEQLLVPVGARDLAMSGSNVAFSRGLDAMYWNPAGFSHLDNAAAGTFSTMSIFNDVKVNYLALGVKVGGLGNLGFSLKSFDFGDIPYTTNQDWDGSSGRTFSPTFITGALTYSRQLTDLIQVGMTAKLVHESVPRASASAMAFDMGLQYHQLGGVNGLSMGLVVKNIGTNMQYAGSGLLTQAVDVDGNRIEFRDRPAASHQLPATVELGLGYRRSIDEQNSVIFNGNFENNNFGNDNFKFGVEYSYGDLIALRGGYRLVNDTDSEDILYRFTAGMGLNFQLSGTDLRFDYTFRDSRYYDGNNLFALTIGF